VDDFINEDGPSLVYDGQLKSLFGPEVAEEARLAHLRFGG
jgi:hypothetical protein